MRVAIVCPYDLDVPGGVQNHVRQLARELAHRGDEVLTVSPGGSAGPADGGPAHADVGPSLGIRFNDSVAPISLRPAAARRTVQALQRFEPDVVHVHEPAVPAVSLAAALRGPGPLVATFHAWSDRDTLYRMARPLVRRAYERLDARIAVSPAAAAYHAGGLGVPQSDFTVVPNAIEVARFADARPLDEVRAAPGPVLLFVGRLERRKGLEQLIRAFAVLKTTRPDVRLLVIGDGPERDRCQSLLPSRLRVDVDFLGRVDQDDLPRFYASADVFVAPALGGESFGIVLLEAMAAGAAVVASDLPGFRSVVRDGVDGTLVPVGEPRALAAAVDALLENGPRRKAMADEARERVAGFDWSAVAARVRDVYEATIG